jgi:hypothetical protein
MEWTVANVQPEMWPAAFGLGNELQYYLPAAQWAGDSVTMYELVREIFAPRAVHPSQVPGTYGPCNSGPWMYTQPGEWSTHYLVSSEWSTHYLVGRFPTQLAIHIQQLSLLTCASFTFFAWNDNKNNVTVLHPQALDAFTFHGYQHGLSSVESVASMNGSEVDASRGYFASVAAMHAQANTTSKLWITETSWSATPPHGAINGSGATAAINGMSRASDMAWYIIH